MTPMLIIALIQKNLTCRFSVRLGDHDIFSEADEVTPLEVEVAEVIKHPKYDPATFYNDIGILIYARYQTTSPNRFSTFNTCKDL
jgi:hypothetical protein